MTINLIEKQLTIFTQSLFLPSTDSSAGHGSFSAGGSSGSGGGSSGSGGMRESLSLSSASSDSAIEMHLTWAQFAQFCVVAALWFLQQAVAANALLAQCSNLTLPELDALRFGFSQYDTDLSGVISTADLYCLLQVMLKCIVSFLAFQVIRATHCSIIISWYRYNELALLHKALS